MKRILLAVAWSFLLIFGVYAQFTAWTDKDLSYWLEVLLRIPLTAWTLWTFYMLYDVWMAAKPKSPNPTFTEAPRVEVKTGELLYVNDVLYRFTEMSHTMEFDGTSSRIVLESVDSGKGGIRTVRVTPPDGM